MASVKRLGNSYKIVVSNGYDVNGKKLRETTTFTPDPKQTPKQQEKALEAFVFSFEQKVKNGNYLDGEKITLKEFADLWLKEYGGQQLEPTTLSKYTHELNDVILPALGHIKLAKLQPLHLQSFYNNLLEDGIRRDSKSGGYSPTTIKRYHAVLSTVLKTATKWQVVEANICDRVSPPKPKKEVDKVNFFTVEQAVLFLDSLDKIYIDKHKEHDRIDDTGKKYHVPSYTQSRTVPLQHRLLF